MAIPRILKTEHLLINNFLPQNVTYNKKSSGSVSHIGDEL